MGRSHFTFRRAVVADDRDGLLAELARPQSASSSRKSPQIAFLLTGQGSQYAGMASGLAAREPVFRAVLERCDRLFASIAPAGPSLLSVLFSPEHAARIDETEYAQPALFALHVALAELWRRFGIAPVAVLGHSIGEIAAATIAGALSIEDGLRFAAHRGRLMQSLPRDGAMAAIFADAADVARAIAETGGRVSIAAFNGPRETVISGARDVVAAIVARFTAADTRCRELVTSHAFHSPLMDPILEPLGQMVPGLGWSAPRIDVISTLSGEPATMALLKNPRYWRDQARSPVRFVQAMRSLVDLGVDCCIEIGPQPMLIGLGRRCVADPDTLTWLPSLRRDRDDSRQIAESLAALYACGATVDWTSVHAARPGRRVALPTYPFARQRYWVDMSLPVAPDRVPSNAHPVLGSRIRSPLPEIQFQAQIAPRSLPLARSTSRGWHSGDACRRLDRRHAVGGATRPRSWPDRWCGDSSCVRPSRWNRTRRQRFRPSSRAALMAALHCGSPQLWATSGATSPVPRLKPAAVVSPAVTLASARARCTEALSTQALYAEAQTYGIDLGPMFQGVDASVGRRQRTARPDCHFPPTPRLDGGIVCDPPGSSRCGDAGGCDTAAGAERRRPRVPPRRRRPHRAPRRRADPRRCLLEPCGDEESAVRRRDGRCHALRLRRAGAARHRGPAFSGCCAGRPDHRRLRRNKAPSTRSAGVSAPHTAMEARPARWLLCAAEHDAAAASLVTQLRAAGQDCLRVTSLAHAIVGGDERGVLYLPDPRSSAEARCLALVDAIQTLARHAAAPRLRVVTRGAHSVADDDEVAPEETALWGLAAVVALEQPALWGGIVDLPRAPAEADFTAMATTLTIADSEDRLAIRRGQRFVPRLLRCPAEIGQTPLRLPCARTQVTSSPEDPAHLVWLSRIGSSITGRGTSSSSAAARRARRRRLESPNLVEPAPPLTCAWSMSSTRSRSTR